MTTLGIIVFSALIMALLQLTPGVFALFMHHCAGKYPRKKASDQALFFILGVETTTIVLLMFAYIIISSMPSSESLYHNPIFAWIIAGITLALSIAIFACYYQKGRGSKLFISRRLVSNINRQIESSKTRSDAFVLGALSPTPELLFTFPLYIITSISIMQIDSTCTLRALIIILFAIITILPLCIMHIRFPKSNLAHIARLRTKDKTFFKTIISLLYLMVAILIILGVAI